MARILIIDDDQVFSAMLSSMVRNMGHQVTTVSTLSGGLREASSGGFDVVFLDVCLPDGNGLQALSAIQEAESYPEVIIVTGMGEMDGASLAVKHGAWDYIEKPSTMQDMTLPLIRALQYREERKVKDRVAGLKALDCKGIVGSSPKLRACLDLVAQVACSDTNVLITGETGTGKELFASAIHRNSPRADRPFVVVDCSSLPETLVESMLFGYAKGSFTGADRPKEGLVKQADGGTLFLDEVGEMPLSIQKSFLRVLQERAFRPLGAGEEVHSDFRLIAATNKNLQQMVQERVFREDLLFRIKAFSLDLPPLRERTPDMEELATWFIARLSHRHSMGLKGFSPEFMEALIVYQWPGNVRELSHAMERAFTSAYHESTLFPKHLPDEIRIQYMRTGLAGSSRNKPVRTNGPLQPKTFPKIKDYREAMDRQYLFDLLVHTKGNRKEASRVSGLSRSRLYDLLKQFNMMESETNAPLPGRADTTTRS